MTCQGTANRPAITPEFLDQCLIAQHKLVCERYTDMPFHSDEDWDEFNCAVHLLSEIASYAQDGDTEGLRSLLMDYEPNSGALENEPPMLKIEMFHIDAVAEIMQPFVPD